MAPDSPAALQVLAAPLLKDVVCGITITPDALDGLLAFADGMGHTWAALVLRLSVARAYSLAGNDAAAFAILDPAIPVIERVASWAVNAPLVFAYSVDVLWNLERTDHLAALERNVREKWLEPDIRYPENDSRWHVALLSALDGRIDEARKWFAESRRVLVEEGAEPLVVGVDYDATLMELRLGGRPAMRRSSRNASRPRAPVARTPQWRAWLPRLDDLEARAATTF